MPTIQVVESPVGQDKSVEVAQGGALADIADAALLPIPFSCRSASCATCHVAVLEGADLLEPPEEEEQELLDIVGGPPGSRLSCQARVKAGAGLIRLKPL